MGCDGCVTYLSLEPYPGEGVGPFHSREVPLPLTRDEIGSPLTNGNGFPYAEGWRLRRAGDVDVNSLSLSPRKKHPDSDFEGIGGKDVDVCISGNCTSSNLHNTAGVICDTY